MDISKALKEERELQKKSQSEVARETGISQQNISNYESGKTVPDVFSAYVLAKYYNVSIEELIEKTAE